MEYLDLKPEEIEKRSMEIIEAGLDPSRFDPRVLPIVKRVIHTTADFDFAENLFFSKDVTERAKEALLSGATLITDTNMALAGINKTALARIGAHAQCFMADESVARLAKERGVTRAMVSMEKAMQLPGPKIFAVGNAPTALLSLNRQIMENAPEPALIIAVPVGFVNVEYAKELIRQTCLSRDIPIIAAMGRKGGSAVAASIINALMYMIE